MGQRIGGVEGMEALLEALRRNRGRDSIGPMLDAAAWAELAPHLVPRAASDKEVVISQGASDRSLYFVESGTLRIYRADHNKRLQLAVLGPGSIVGEGTFFAPILRNAFAEAAEPTRMWELTPEAFGKLRERNPSAACEISMALGAVISIRMLSVAGRLAIT